MAREILCNEGLTLELWEQGQRTFLALSWDEDPDHQISAEVNRFNLFSVLNGMRYTIDADPWSCVIRLDGPTVVIDVDADDLTIMSCGFPRSDYEDALLRSFQELRQGYRA